MRERPIHAPRGPLLLVRSHTQKGRGARVRTEGPERNAASASASASATQPAAAAAAPRETTIRVDVGVMRAGRGMEMVPEATIAELVKSIEAEKTAEAAGAPPAS